MKMYKYMLTGAAAGYALGCRMGQMRRYAQRSFKQMKRFISRKLGI